MGKNTLKKIGVISIGVLTLLSTSLSIVAIVKVSRGHHMHPCPSSHIQEGEKHGPNGKHEPKEPENGPQCHENDRGPKDHAQDDQHSDKHDQRPPKIDERKKDNQSQNSEQKSEDKHDPNKNLAY